MVWNKLSKLSFEQTVNWIKTSNGGVVLCCTLNEMMMAEKDKGIGIAMSRAYLLTPDGMPLVWYLKWKYGKGERVYGPDIMSKILNSKAQNLKTMLFVGDSNNQRYFSEYGEYVILPFKDSFDDDDYKKVVEAIKKVTSKNCVDRSGSKKTNCCSG